MKKYIWSLVILNLALLFTSNLFSNESRKPYGEQQKAFSDNFKTEREKLSGNVKKLIMTQNFARNDKIGSGTGHWNKIDEQNFENNLKSINKLDSIKDKSSLLWIYLEGEIFWETRESALEKLLEIKNDKKLEKILLKVLKDDNEYIEFRHKIFWSMILKKSKKEKMLFMKELIASNPVPDILLDMAREYINLGEKNKAKVTLINVINNKNTGTSIAEDAKIMLKVLTK